MPNRITSFDNEYAFLSNFHPCQVVFDGRKYANSEAAFQAAKLADPNDRVAFEGLSPRDAKRMGRKVELRPDWETVKDAVMLVILRDKFTRTPRLGEMLVETGDAVLVEGNYWHDNYWGDCSCPRCRLKPGKNKLGKLLMQVRDEIREGRLVP